MASLKCLLKLTTKGNVGAAQGAIYEGFVEVTLLLTNCSFIFFLGPPLLIHSFLLQDYLVSFGSLALAL